MPMTAAISPAAIESAPRPGPIERSSRIINGAGNAPARKTSANSFVSATLKSPVICPLPKICDWIPEKLTVISNYPNPFNPKTKIEIFIENDSHITLDIFTINGHKVRTLFDGNLLSGVNNFTWDGKNGSGEKVSSGTYIGTLIKNGSLIGSNRMLMIK